MSRREGVQAIPPFVIVALVQAVMQVVVACIQTPEDAVAWLEGERRFRLGWLMPSLREGRIRRMVAESWDGDHSQLPEITEAVVRICRHEARLDTMRELYQENKPQ